MPFALLPAYYINSHIPLCGSRPLQAIAGVIIHRKGINTVRDQNQLKCVSLKIKRDHSFYAFNHLLSVYYNVLPPPPEIQHDDASIRMTWAYNNSYMYSLYNCVPARC